MIRKILEKGIFHSLVRNGVPVGDLKDSSGRFLGLDHLLKFALNKNVKGLPILSSKTHNNILGLKYLGDESAHNYLATVDMRDLIPQLPFIAIGFKEIARCL